MAEMINNVIEELKQIFKYEKIILKEDYISNNYISENFKSLFGERTLFIIRCGYTPKNKDDIINIHYTSKYGGSRDFNNILKKYNLDFDWFDFCDVIIFKKQE